MNKLYKIIKRPIISEKGTLLSEVNNSFVFEVDAASNRQEIRQAVEKLFNVKVDGVRTLMVQGKLKRTGRNILKNQNWKKAIVTLKEGNKIQFIQGA